MTRRERNLGVLIEWHPPCEGVGPADRSDCPGLTDRSDGPAHAARPAGADP